MLMNELKNNSKESKFEVDVEYFDGNSRIQSIIEQRKRASI